MKKIFFLICMLVLMPVFSYAAYQNIAATYGITSGSRSEMAKQFAGLDPEKLIDAAYSAYLDSYVIALREFRDTYLQANKLSTQFVIFLQKHSRRAADPIITYETLRNAQKLALKPVFFVNDYPNFTLLILTTILLILTIARRKQLEHAPATVQNLSYCNAVR